MKNNINDLLKMALNEMQCHIESETKTDNVLLIFDNEIQKDRYMKLLKNKNACLIDRIPITLDELSYTNKLVGTRFKRYVFITDDDIKYLESQE